MIKETLWLRLFTPDNCGGKSLAVIFNKGEQQQQQEQQQFHVQPLIQSQPPLPPPTTFHPNTPQKELPPIRSQFQSRLQYQQPPKRQIAVNNQGISSIRCGEDRTGDTARKPIEIVRSFYENGRTMRPLSDEASRIKRLIKENWEFCYNFVEDEVTGPDYVRKPRVKFIYQVTYFGRGPSQERANVDAIKKAITSYGVTVDSEALAEEQLRGLVHSVNEGDGYPKLVPSQEGQGDFKTTLHTLESVTVRGDSFEEIYRRIWNSKMEIEEEIEKARRK